MTKLLESGKKLVKKPLLTTFLKAGGYFSIKGELRQNEGANFKIRPCLFKRCCFVIYIYIYIDIYIYFDKHIIVYYVTPTYPVLIKSECQVKLLSSQKTAVVTIL